MTKSDRIIAGLRAMGESELKSRSRKFRTFTCKHGGFYFIGRNGALRIGRTVSESRAVWDSQKDAVIQRGEAVAAEACDRAVRRAYASRRPAGAPGSPGA